MQDRPTCSLLSKRGDVGRRRMLSARRERGQENGTGARSPACRDGELGLLRGPGVFTLFLSEPWKRLGGVREAACRCVRVPVRVCAFASPHVHASRVLVRARPLRARAFSCVRAHSRPRACVRARSRACLHLRAAGGRLGTTLVLLPLFNQTFSVLGTKRFYRKKGSLPPSTA